MKPVYIYAFLEGNLGDDLLVRVLCKRYPRTEFCTMSTAENRERFRDIKNLTVYTQEDEEVVKRNQKDKKKGIDNGFFVNLIKTCEAVVQIGGSVFVQHKEDYSLHYGIDRYLVENSKKMYIIGANFGPYTDEKYYEDYHELFKKHKGICFRDSYSAGKFADLPNTACAPDTVLSRRVMLLEEKQRVAVVAPIDVSRRKGRFGISEYSEAYLDNQAMLIRNLLQRGYGIRMISFCPSQGDGIAMQAIMDRLTPGERQFIYCIGYNGDNMDEALEAFERSELVVGTRFHSVILGLQYKCKILPVIYNEKTRNALADLKFPMKAELSELQSMDIPAVLDALVSQEPMNPVLLRNEADKQFQYLDELLLPKKFYA